MGHLFFCLKNSKFFSGLKNWPIVPPITTGNSPLGKKNTSGHHFKSGACNTVSCAMTWLILYSETGSSTCLYQ